MKKIIIASCLLTSPVFALGERPLHLPKVIELDYAGHSYLCFNGTHYVHNPECNCRISMKGFMNDGNKIKEIILYREMNKDH